MPLFKTVNVLDVPFINATEADFFDGSKGANFRASKYVRCHR